MCDTNGDWISTHHRHPEARVLLHAPRRMIGPGRRPSISGLPELGSLSAQVGQGRLAMAPPAQKAGVAPQSDGERTSSNGAPHCALMLAARITLPHLSVSSTMIWPHCAGVSGTVSLPRSAN